MEAVETEVVVVEVAGTEAVVVEVTEAVSGVATEVISEDMVGVVTEVISGGVVAEGAVSEAPGNKAGTYFSPPSVAPTFLTWDN